MYSPTLGRWAQLDPIGFAAGDPNLYRFVGNNPTGMVDPSGLSGTKGGSAGEGATQNVVDELSKNHAQNRYWVCIFSSGVPNPRHVPEASNGHAWIGLIDAKAGTSKLIGLWNTKLVSNKDRTCPSEVRDDKEMKFVVARCFPVGKDDKISAKDYDLWIKYFNKLETTKTKDYNLATNNCTTFTITSIGPKWPKLYDSQKTTILVGANPDDTDNEAYTPYQLSDLLKGSNCSVPGSVLVDKSGK